MLCIARSKLAGALVNPCGNNFSLILTDPIASSQRAMNNISTTFPRQILHGLETTNSEPECEVGILKFRKCLGGLKFMTSDRPTLKLEYGTPKWTKGVRRGVWRDVRSHCVCEEAKVCVRRRKWVWGGESGCEDQRSCVWGSAELRVRSECAVRSESCVWAEIIGGMDGWILRVRLWDPGWSKSKWRMTRW
jgi:hypothetical protein